MENLLTITADREDYAVGLSGILHLEGFSGRGKGWFNNSDIKNFCSSLINLSKTMEGKVELIGSDGKKGDIGYLETFALRLYILSDSKLNGIIGIHCTLAERQGSDCRKEEILKMSGEIQVRNQHIVTLANDLQELMSGAIDEVRLIGDLSVF
ncbi:MAG: hypothetical protein GY760_28200 [Deltaproteobacteria bacterium]|nr:hypothetical protein [Deltaproteobacteria bacterium]